MRKHVPYLRSRAAMPRWPFLDALEMDTPEVLETLRDDVFPIYCALPRELKRQTSHGPKIERMVNTIGWLYPNDPPETEILRLPDLLTYSGLNSHNESPEARNLALALNTWATRYNLTDHWLFDLALQTVFHWERVKDAVKDPQWWGLGDLTRPSVVSEEERRFSFTDPGWAPGYESWGMFEKRLRSGFEQQFQTYKKQITPLPERRGFRQPPEIRKPDHFRYLVRYQVLGESPETIAEHFSKDQRVAEKGLDGNTVLKAVKKTAGQIGLTLRPSRKGRTKKT